jgi:hypothetical protein
VLLALASSLMMLRVMRRGEATTAIIVGYIAFATLGVAAHLYMLMVIAVQIVACLTVPRLKQAQFVRWPPIPIIAGMVLQEASLHSAGSNSRGRLFRAGFPIDLARALLGQHWIAVALGLALVVVGARRWLHVPPLPLLVGVVLAEMLLVWVVAPFDLYTRFFVWTLPALAVATVFGALLLTAGPRWSRPLPWVACAVVVGAQLATALPGADRPVYENRRTAEIMLAAATNGASVCVLPASSEPLLGYLDVRTAETVSQLEDCDVVASIAPDRDAPLIPRVESLFPNHLVLDDATVPGTIYTKGDVSCLTAPAPSCWPGS